QRLWLHLHQSGGNLERLVAHVGGGDRRGIARHYRRTGSMRPDSEGYAVRAPVHHPYLAVVHTQDLCAHLRHGSLEALPERGTARDHFHHATGLYRHMRAISGSKTTLLHERHEAETGHLASPASLPRLGLRLVPPEPLECPVEQERVVARIVADVVAENR